MKNGVTYKILKNFSEGKYSWNDYKKVKSWFNHINDYQEAKNYLLEQWNELNEQKKPDEHSLQHIYYEIEHQLLMEERKETGKKQWIKFYQKAAAILLIPLMAFFAWYYFNNSMLNSKAWVEINAPEGTRTQFSLPDGSKGWLNSGSKLKYNPVFRVRNVELRGEAWFDVEHDKTTFTVKTSKMDISVLGTQFNVMSYDDENFAEVVLEKGKVEVTGTDKYFKKVLVPGEKLKFLPEENKYTVQQINTQPYTAWKDGFLMLNNETLEQEVSRIDRWYNVDIEIKDDTLKNYRFKATFHDEPLEEVLRLMAITTPMEYTIEKRETGANNVYNKKKVIIERKK